MVWEVVFMLVLLKIPIVYLCTVVWWAIRAEPHDERPSVAARIPDTPASPPGWSRPPRAGGRPDDGRRGARQRAGSRPHAVRSQARP
jgi:hypothetical protein